jgi:putative effector of murein hydrolase
MLVLTTLLSYVASFAIAAGLYKIEGGLGDSRKRRWAPEKRTQPKRHTSKIFGRTSNPRQPTSIIIISSDSSSSVGNPGLSSTMARFTWKVAPLWVTLFLLITVGIPVYRLTNYDMPFETFYFIFLWIGALQFQRSIHSCAVLESRPRVRSTLAILLNPVLVTAGLGTAYFWTEAAVTHQSIDDVLTSFHQHDSWAEIIRQSAADHSPQRHIGAGDLSAALLDAGIVSLGFKMFEHRHALWAARATVLATSLALATANALAGVAVAARAAGLPPADALAFAARSATVALGVPAVRRVGGSTTLMSALVVFGGMLWQMAGDAVLGWMGVRDRRPTGNDGSLRPRQRQDRTGTEVRVQTASGASGEEGGVEEEPDDAGDDYKVVAAGVTVGINAAAMGTAHLIERHSRATAYSALSMTIFGVFTVALTSVPLVADTLIMLASR